MAKLRKMFTYTDYRGEETEELTPEQVEKWKSGDEDLQEEVLDEVEFELARCATDIVYFAEKYAVVMTDEGIQQVKLREYQKRMLRNFQERLDKVMKEI